MSTVLRYLFLTGAVLILFFGIGYCSMKIVGGVSIIIKGDKYNAEVIDYSHSYVEVYDKDAVGISRYRKELRYSPIVQFRTKDGEVIQYTLDYSSNSISVEVGGTYTAYYDSESEKLLVIGEDSIGFLFLSVFVIVVCGFFMRLIFFGKKRTDGSTISVVTFLIYTGVLFLYFGMIYMFYAFRNASLGVLLVLGFIILLMTVMIGGYILIIKGKFDYLLKDNSKRDTYRRVVRKKKKKKRK
ncbi:hypothetical protein ACKLNQ_09230 [Myroides odoratimimus]|uniref:hypothetical protein n=1 Tax=Myroides odoratimimus TaxID=76832 RepID=UPI0038D4D4B4